jgi:hypothetical protein
MKPEYYLPEKGEKNGMENEKVPICAICLWLTSSSGIFSKNIRECSAQGYQNVLITYGTEACKSVYTEIRTKEVDKS